MSSEPRDPDKSANVSWLPRNTPAPATISGGDKIFFARLEDAIRYVMNELSEDVRGTAWITLDEGGSIRVEEIKTIYEKLPRTP